MNWTPFYVTRARRSREFLAAARWCARRHLSGDVGDPLPALMSLHTVHEINNNLRQFQISVAIAHKQLFGY